VTQAQQKAKELLGTSTQTPTTDPAPAETPTIAASADPLARPARRQSKSPLTGTTTDPLP
jgi:hypothetical protein